MGLNTYTDHFTFLHNYDRTRSSLVHRNNETFSIEVCITNLGGQWSGKAPKGFGNIRPGG